RQRSEDLRGVGVAAGGREPPGFVEDGGGVLLAAEREDGRPDRDGEEEDPRAVPGASRAGRRHRPESYHAVMASPGVPGPRRGRAVGSFRGGTPGADLVDVAGLQPFRALRDLEFHALHFLEGLVSLYLYRRDVGEDVRSVHL